MVLDSLGDNIKNAVNKLKNHRGSLSEEDIDPVIKEIQRALLQSDVSVEIVKELSNNIKERAINSEKPTGVTVKDHVLNIVYEELKEIVGDSLYIPLESQKILLAGLQGTGKTTSAAKMAWWFSKKGLKPAVIQTDTFRPGAHDQLNELSKRAEVMSYTDKTEKDPVKLAKKGLKETKEADIHIVDTAGRHSEEDKLIEEIEEIKETVKPDLKLLAIDASLGQGVKKQAERFNDSIGIDGIIITKMDGTAKGGGAITASKISDSNIAFLGVGEEIVDIERFEPNGFISRILGMGDMKQLSERVERAIHSTDKDDWDTEDLFKGDFTLYDMKNQMEMMTEMGSLDTIMNMIPGGGSNLMSHMNEDMLSVQEDNMRKFQIIMDSMTKKEMNNPKCVDNDRKERIARGSGMEKEDINELLKQYNKMNKVFSKFDSKDDIKNMGGMNINKLAKKFG